MPFISIIDPMHTDDLDLNLLGVLDALLRERSVTRASHALGLTQSATSHALKRLRTFFDDPLLVKVGNRMEPTRKAEALRPAIVEVMATVRRQILAGARFDPATTTRRFTLCMTDIGELAFLPPLLERLKRDAPACSIRTLQVPSEQVESLLAAGEADLALGSDRAVPRGLHEQRLYQQALVTLVSPKNRRIGRRLTREQFEASPHIVVSLTGRSVDNHDKALDELGIRRRIALVTPHFLMLPLLIDKHPELIATVPRELAEVFAALGLVRLMAVPVAVPPIELKQHWHPRFHHDPAIAWLRGLIAELFVADAAAG